MTEHKDNGYTALTAAPRKTFVPFAWVITYGIRSRHWIEHDDTHDYAYAIQHAVDLRGQLISLYADRRKEPRK